MFSCVGLVMLLAKESYTKCGNGTSDDIDTKKPGIPILTTQHDDFSKLTNLGSMIWQVGWTLAPLRSEYWQEAFSERKLNNG